MPFTPETVEVISEDRVKYGITLTRFDDLDAPGLDAVVAMSSHFIEIGLDGYGEQGAAVGYGYPVLIELTKDGPRVCVFADINSEEPTHIIPLAGALESARKEEVAAAE